MKRILLLVNPISGKRIARKNLMDLCQILSGEDNFVTVHVTRFAFDATQFVMDHGKEFDILVACGGDGTLNEVISGALSSSFDGDIGFLPCGTTNDLAHSLGLPATLTRAARVIASGKAKPLDFGLFNHDRYFTYIASFGAFTEVSYSTDQNMKNIFGHVAYVAEAFSRLKDLRSYHVRIDCDGTVLEDDFIFGAAANSLSIGGVLKLKRDKVDMHDGYHELLLVQTPKNPAALARLSKELISGEYSDRAVSFLRGKEITFTCDEPIAFCVDGESAGSHKTASITNVHDRVKIFYP